MAKRLYNILSVCNDEEEVKSEFAKFFKIKLVTHTPDSAKLTLSKAVQNSENMVK